MRKIMAVFLSILFTFSISLNAYAVSAANKTENADSAQIRHAVSSSIAAWGDNISISATKELQDFSGNRYTVIECAPAGYLIYNNESGLIVEKAKDSPSPYNGRSGTLYYGGPTHYYEMGNDGACTHTITGSVIDNVGMQAYAQNCNQLQLSLNLESASANESAAPRTSVVPHGPQYTYVAGRGYFFIGLDTQQEMSYYDLGDGRGVCGYIAAGLLLLYYDYFHNSGIIDDATYLNSYGSAYVGSDFTEYLFETIGQGQLNYGNTLDAVEIKNVITTYLSYARNISNINLTSVYAPGKLDVVSQLMQDRPVIFVDNWYSPDSTEHGWHAVLAYGYGSNNEIIAHYGWPGYAHVEVTSVAWTAIGSTACWVTSY